MKINYILLALIAFIVSDCSQNKDNHVVTEVVKTSFSKTMPIIKNVHWSYENGNYEAEFTQNHIETSLLFDADGKLLETEVAIADSLLPPTAQTYIKEHYSGKKIIEMARITDYTNRVIYEVEVNGYDVLFDSTGSFITSIKN